MKKNVMNWIASLGFAALISLGNMLLAEEDKKKDDAAAALNAQLKEQANHQLSLAALMIKDGHYDRAEKILTQMDIHMEGFDRARYHTMTGLVHLYQNQFVPAAKQFQMVVDLGKAEAITHVYLAQARFGQQDFKGTLQALELGGELVEKMAPLLNMKIQSLWETGDKLNSLAHLDVAISRFPKQGQFLRTKFSRLLELGLHDDAHEWGLRFLQDHGKDASSYLMIGDSLRRVKQHQKAAQVLEMGLLKFVGNEKILVSSAFNAMEAGELHSSARFFEQAALSNAKYLKEATEMNRRAGRLHKALFLNSQMEDQTLKCKQRLEILIDSEKFEEAASLGPRLSRLGLMKDEKILYAMAYVYFMIQDDANATLCIKGIKDPKIYRNAMKLIKAMESRSAHDLQASN